MPCGHGFPPVLELGYVAVSKLGPVECYKHELEPAVVVISPPLPETGRKMHVLEVGLPCWNRGAR